MCDQIVELLRTDTSENPNPTMRHILHRGLGESPACDTLRCTPLRCTQSLREKLSHISGARRRPRLRGRRAEHEA
jgi:hypothetical protein